MLPSSPALISCSELSLENGREGQEVKVVAEERGKQRGVAERAIKLTISHLY